MMHKRFRRFAAILVTLLMVLTATGISEGLIIESEYPSELGEISLYTPEYHNEVSEQEQDDSPFDASGKTDATNSCAHNQLHVDYETEGDSKTKSQDNEYHVITVKVKESVLFCRDCWEEIARYSVNRTVSYNQYHDYIFDLESSTHCDECGKTKSSCSHSRYKTYSTWVDRIYVNATYHLKIDYDLDGSKALVCENCGLRGCLNNGQKWWGIAFIPEMNPYSSKLEKHTFVNGVCTGCGNSEEKTAATVTLAAKKVTLGAGEKYALSPEVSPASAANKVTFKSTNEKIAKVNSKGKITALKKGTATIKAIVDGKALATCKVTVKAKPTKVTLNKTKLTIKKGDTYTLKASFSSGAYSNKLTWKSSKTAVAKVSSNGVVTAVKAGTATITVTAYNGVKATCKVTVKDTSESGIELSGYYKKDIHKAASAIGGMRYVQLYPEDGVKEYYDNDVLVLYGWDNVTSIRLIGKSNYMLLGIKYGMSRETIREKMKGYSLRWYDDHYGAEYIIKGSIGAAEALLYVEYDDNGKAIRVEYGIWS